MSNLMEYMIQIADQIRELQEDADDKMEVILKEIALIQVKLHELDEKIKK
jgi:vacuolar-type H+-ATPase subunit D/Vma8